MARLSRIDPAHFHVIAQLLNCKKEAPVTQEKEFFGVKYKEGSLDPKTAQLVFFAVCIAIGHSGGAKRHLDKARECGATEDEIREAVVYAMRPSAAKVRDLAKEIIAQ
jgi:alkylhydroperoxidase/carboxymuconolactone decarboxylase family protein YurZ